MSDQPPSPFVQFFRFVINAAVCAAVLGAAAWGIIVIRQTQPTAKEISTKRTSAAPVETTTARRGDYQPRITVLGTVRPAQNVTLGPRVSGQVTEIAPDFVPGGMIQAGEVLLRIDPSDFENALQIRRAELQQAEAALAIEQARHGLAAQELDLLGESIPEADRALVLREPQLASITSQVTAAKAAVRQAVLDLDRTTVRAPFDAQILQRTVDIGTQVAPGNDLGQLVGTGEYWVIAAVPMPAIPWIAFGNTSQAGSSVTLKDVDKPAHVTRMIGALDQQTRLVRVLITVPNPLESTAGETPMILDSLIEVTILGQPIQDVVRLERDLVHDDDTVWILNNDVLEIRHAEIVFRDSQYAYIRSGVDDNARVVTTNLSTVAEGIALRDINGATPDTVPNGWEADQ